MESTDIGKNMNVARLRNNGINTFVSFICMLVCYFLRVVLLTMVGTRYKDKKTEWTFATTVVFMNSSINPICIAGVYASFNLAVLQINCKLLLKIQAGRTNKVLYCIVLYCIIANILFFTTTLRTPRKKRK